MDFAKIINEEQYASTISESNAVPTVFPEWAYGEELNAAQKRIAKAKEDDKRQNPRGSIDFVPAVKSGASSKTGTPSKNGLRQNEEPKHSASYPAGKRQEHHDTGCANVRADMVGRVWDSDRHG